MAPDTGIRSAQSEKPGDQHLTTPLPPTTGTEAKAITLVPSRQPDRTLVRAPVETKDGHKIGEVAQVTLDANGKASEVVLNDAAQTRLAAGEVVFEPERGVLITQLSPSDLAPARQPTRPHAPVRPASARAGCPRPAAAGTQEPAASGPTIWRQIQVRQPPAVLVLDRAAAR